MIYKVELKNYRCYNNHIQDFEDTLNIISGANGTGKTTIVESIAYALFGNKATRGAANEWIKSGNKHGKVKLYLDDYIITRGDNEQYVEHIDGTLLAKQHTGVDSWVEDTYGFNAELYSTANYIAQKDIESFSGLQSAERVNRVEKLLRIDVLDSLKKNIKEQSKPIRKEVEELGFKVKPVINFDLKKSKATLKLLMSDLFIMEGKYKKALIDFGAYKKSLELYNKKNKLKEKVSNITYTDIKFSMEELIIIKQKLEASSLAKKSLKEYSDIISKNRSTELEEVRNTYYIVSNKIKELGDIKEICPTCAQNIPDAHKLLSKKQEYEKELHNIIATGADYKLQFEKFDLEKKVYVSNHTINDINIMIKDLQSLPYVKELKNYSDIFFPKKVDITKITNEYSELTNTVKALETVLKQQEKIIMLNDSYKKDYLTKQSLLNRMENFVIFIDAYRKEFTQNIIPLIENNAAKIFHYLTDNKYANFELQKDYSLKNYDKLSGSESDCASLAIRMAIAKISRIGTFNSI